MIKIFHCGDIHLDTPFAQAPAHIGAAKRAALREHFVYMMRTAKELGANVVLIPGDLFDGALVQDATLEMMSAALEDVGCPVFISPGNHDAYTVGGVWDKIRLPENVYVFKSEALTRVDISTLGISVFGYAFTSQAHASAPLDGLDPTALSDKNINLLCAHTDLYSPTSRYAPITERQLERSGFVYAALAHVHKEPQLMQLGGTTAAYSGFAMGRGFDECGAGGAWLVTVEAQDEQLAVATGKKYVTSAERVAISPAAFEIETVDITGAHNDAQACEIIYRQLSGKRYQEMTSLRIVLTGAVPMTYTPSEATVARLCDVTKSVQVCDMTVPELDTAVLSAELGIKGELYRVLVPMLEGDDPEQRRLAATALKYALCAMAGQDFLAE